MNLVVNHFGLTVTDLERSTAFYTSFGGEVVTGGHFAGPHMDRGLGVDGAELETRMIRFGSVVLELLQYAVPRGAPYSSRNCDTGACHVCFQVDDIHALHDALRSRGVEFYSEPIPLDEGAFAGGFWVYAKDPDGVTVEFIQAGPAAAAATD